MTLELVKGKAGTEEGVLEVLPGVKVVKAGGHFPGSLLLWWERKLFIADTIVTVPVGRTFALFLSPLLRPIVGEWFELDNTANARHSRHIPHTRVHQTKPLIRLCGRSRT